ncbi:MAG: alanyl-tRNA editing protein [Xanthomonadales bacterium]|nr:alanyl-tRNA editing protein [Xanthomonadales bacterium]
MTTALFQDDAYRTQCEAQVVAVDGPWVVLDQTVFYPLGGGQPGDRGQLTTASGQAFIVHDTRKGEAGAIRHLLDENHTLAVGDRLTAGIDWELRHQHMRMHTALHLLGSLVPFGVTGGNISAAKSRLDFDMEGSVDKAELSEQLNALVAADHKVSTRWISDAELAAQPELVRTMSVQPPRGAGRIRLLEIANIDLQPCGGTHVRQTAEIGPLRVSKVEKKGKHNRRISIVFANE